MIIYIALIALFQPFLKVPLGREVWAFVDLVIAVGLLFSVYKTRKEGEKQKEE